MLIFLDIDGVMVPAKSWKSPELLNDGFPAFSEVAIRAFQSLLTEDTTVVLTTSHKSRFSLDSWKNIFENRMLSVCKLESLEENKGFLSRKEEIMNWFKLNAIKDDFLIIDDDKSLNDLPRHLKENLILTSPMIGLTERDLDNVKFKPQKRLQIA
jgi:hypothetical protein